MEVKRSFEALRRSEAFKAEQLQSIKKHVELSRTKQIY
jgi:hypothetical protein